MIEVHSCIFRVFQCYKKQSIVHMSQKFLRIGLSSNRILMMNEEPYSKSLWTNAVLELYDRRFQASALVNFQLDYWARILMMRTAIFPNIFQQPRVQSSVQIEFYWCIMHILNISFIIFDVQSSCHHIYQLRLELCACVVFVLESIEKKIELSLARNVGMPTAKHIFKGH